MKILLAEDDINLGEMLEMFLKRKGFSVTRVINGEDAYKAIYKEGFNLLILDWMMPKLDGIELCKKLRAEDFWEKILLLTAKDTIEDKVMGLNSGADDYLIKPFAIEELVARINALGRRAPSYSEKEEVYGNLIINRTTKMIKNNESKVEIKLTGREFAVLDLLLRNKEIVLPREVIIERIWGLESEVSENNLDAYVKLLRKKLKNINNKDLIKTVRGIGYKI